MTLEHTVVLASRNQGKIRELAALLGQFGLTLKGLDDFPLIGPIEETGKTFEENAYCKAATVSDLTGLISLADDSGLEVDALDGAPGVYSARYSAEPGREATDERNNAKLLAALETVPEARRGARFRSVMAAVAPNGRRIHASGVWEGRIAPACRGANGFGYDPLFFDPELGKTAGEMGAEEKNARSHRAKAVAALMAMWPDFWAHARKG